MAISQEWNYNLDIAKLEAKTQDKKILLLFSTSGWCEKCTDLEKNILSSDSFLKEAQNNWILLKADFSYENHRGVDINDSKIILMEKYNRDGFFPYIVILYKSGKIVGKTGYNLSSPEEYILHLKSLQL